MSLHSVLIISFLIISILGTVLHFTHDRFKKGFFLHIFSAVNESTWEHMKLLVFPTNIVMIFQWYLLVDRYPNLLNSIAVLYIVELITIPLLYEPLRLIFKKVHLIVTIMIFYLAIFFGISTQYLLLIMGIKFLDEQVSLGLIIFITALFAIFTYFPPKLFLFRDPTNGSYGDSGRHG